MTDDSPKLRLVSVVSTIVGVVGGWALARYTGALLAIPAACTFVLFLLFAKTPVRPRAYNAAIAFTGGHVLWFVAGGLVAGVWNAVLLDIMLLLAALAWLWARPGIGAALFLGLLQLGMLAVNATTMAAAAVGSTEHKALVVHCLMRVLAILGIAGGYVVARRQVAVERAADRAQFACPCCDYVTLPDRCEWSVCPVCFWEDDVIGDEPGATSPANGGLTVAQARTNFADFGACERSQVPNVLPTEKRDHFERRARS